jgi:hypothetical protein
MQKHVYPVTKNSVRIVAGGSEAEIFDPNSRDLERQLSKWAIVLTVNSNGKVTITPWDNLPESMKVKQVDARCGRPTCQTCNVDGYDAAKPEDRYDCHYDPRYSNIFGVMDDGFGRLFKTFLLCYEYTNSAGETFLMQEELKLSYVPEIE